MAMKHLHLYDCFDVIGGKRRDNRTPYNTKACTYTLTHVVCSSLGMSLDTTTTTTTKKDKKDKKDKKENKKDRKKRPTKTTTTSSPSTYYGMSRIRNSLHVGEEEDAWTLMLLGGDVDDKLSKPSKVDQAPISEAMRMSDLLKFSQERKVYPEFLFFESNGPTQRDLRSRDREHRVSTSTLFNKTSLPPSITTARVGGIISNSREGERHRGYGTLSRGKEQEQVEEEEDVFRNRNVDTDVGNWCEGANCTLS